VGVDASIDGLRQVSMRAARGGLTNLLYVRSGVEALPGELRGVADRVTAILPWGSLLAALACPVVPVLRGVRGVCQPEAVLTVVFGIDPERDRAEAHRLGLPELNDAFLSGDLAAGYAAAGFAIDRVRGLAATELTRWPSSWARRLAFGGESRRVFEITAVAR
jgi:16S rRNA (adenine(1408)-N(1))-methyltransferase